MSSISEITRLAQEAGVYDKDQCKFCGLPFVRQQNDIRSFGCGSSYAEAFKPQWARSMTCLEIENGQLQGRIKRLEEIGDEMRAWCNDKKSCEQWTASKEAKP